MKYRCMIYVLPEYELIENSTFYADSTCEAMEYARNDTRFNGYQQYIVDLVSNDETFKMRICADSNIVW